MALDFTMRPYLGRADTTLEVLRRHGMSAQKRFGQNFLIDEHVIEKILQIADIGPEDFVLEIGPGIGTMTQYLASRARKVVAVEVDDKLIPVLEDTLQSWNNVTVIHQDILKTDIAALAAGEKLKVVANLPYYITTPIILKLIEEEIPLKSITVMVQKEVADRMQASPGGKEYGALSLAVQYYADPQSLATVPPNCFIPRPKVESALVRLDIYEEPVVKVRDKKHMFRVIRASFNQRRKTLINGLLNSGYFSLTRGEFEELFEMLSFSPTVRGETLSLSQFARLSDAIQEKTESARGEGK